MKYVAEPFIVEAIQWDGTEEGAAKIKKEFGFDYYIGEYNHKPFLEVYTCGRKVFLIKGEYLIKNLMDISFECRASKFKQVFEKVRDKK